MPDFILRKHRRFTRLIPVRYLKSGGGIGEGIITDLSMNGSSIIGQTPVVVDAVLALHMFVPGNPEPSLIENVTVKWVNESEFGVAFEIMRSEVGDRLAVILSNAVQIHQGSIRDC